MTDQKAEEQQFNYETFEEVLEEIKEKDYDTVGLQGPDGIKPQIIDFADELKENGFETVIVGASTFWGLWNRR